MNWVLMVLSFFLPIVQQEIHHAQQQRYHQPQPQNTLYHVDGKWYTYAHNNWYVWTQTGWVLNLPQGAAR